MSARAGLNVLDGAHVIAGAHGAPVLTELGAEVIEIGAPDLATERAAAVEPTEVPA